MSGSKPKSIAILVLLGAVFLLLLFFNFQTGMVADDFIFCFSRAHWDRITSVRDILISLAVLRREINGRVFAHFFAMFFLLQPKFIFNFLNAAISTSLFYILYRLVRRGEPRRDVPALLFLLATLWLLTPAYGQDYLWLTGSCNYSWTMFVSFLFLTPYLELWLGRTRPAMPGWRRSVLRGGFLLLAFLAGGWSENGGLAMLFTAFCLLTLCFLRDRRLPRFLCAAFLVACGGFLFLMLSPSELHGRRGEVAESTLARAVWRAWALLRAQAPVSLLAAAGFAAVLLSVLLVWLLIRRRRTGCRLCAALLLLVGGLSAVLLARFADDRSFFGLLSDTRLCMLLALCLYLLLLLAAYERQVSRETLLCAAVLGLAAIASVAVFFFAVYFPARSACPFVTYTTLADAMLLQALWDQKSSRGPALRILAAALTAVMLLTLPGAARDIWGTGELLRQRRALLERLGREQPDTIVTVEPITPRSKYPACWPGDENYFVIEMGRYYGLREVDVSSYVNEGG